jgi:hypothetical protein
MFYTFDESKGKQTLQTPEHAEFIVQAKLGSSSNTLCEECAMRSDQHMIIKLSCITVTAVA